MYCLKLLSEYTSAFQLLSGTPRLQAGNNNNNNNNTIFYLFPLEIAFEVII
jgi:hypothetical protein